VGVVNLVIYINHVGFENSYGYLPVSLLLYTYTSLSGKLRREGL
jgi:hypothetical protein